MKTFLLSTLLMTVFFQTSLSQCGMISTISPSTTYPYSSITFTWPHVNGATGYYAYYMYWYDPFDTSNHTYMAGWNPTNSDPYTATNSVTIPATPGNYYFFAVRPNCDTNFTVYYFTNPCPGLISAPTTSFASFSSIIINWLETGAAGYYVQHRVQGDSNWTTSPPIWNPPSTPIGDPMNYTLPQPINAGVVYEYRVTVFCPFSNGASAIYTTSLPTCNLVTNLHVGTSANPCNQVNLIFTNTTPANLVSHYKIDYWKQNDSANSYISKTFANVPTSSQTNITKLIDSLEYSTTYIARVSKLCVNGYGPPASVSFTTAAPAIPCNPPSLITVNSPLINGTGFTITWPGNSTNISQFQWRIKKQSEPATNWGSIQTVSANTYSVVVSNLETGTWYDIQVRSKCINCNAVSIWANASYPTVCPQPAGFNIPSVGITAYTALAKWLAVPNAASYTVSKRLTNGVWDTVCLQTTDTSCLLTNLASGKNYQCRVKTTCAGGSSTADSTLNILNFTTPCVHTATISIMAVSNSSLSLNWSQVNGALNYKLEYKNSSSSSFWTTVVNNLNASSYTITGIPSSYTSIDIRIRTNCSSGGTSQADTILSNIPMGCTPPTNLTSYMLNATSAVIKWNTIPGSTEYEVEYRNADASGSAGAWNTIYTITDSIVSDNLEYLTNYQAKVKTRCFDNEWGDDFSATYSFKTPCPSVTGISIVPGLNTATAKWNKVAGAYSYKIQYGLVNTNGQVSVWNTMYNSPDSDTDINLGSLVSSADYILRIQTKCSSNSEDTSLFVSQAFKTLGPCVPPPLNIDSVSFNSISVSWNPLQGAGVLNYRIRYKVIGTVSWNQSPLLSGTNYIITNLDPGISYLIQITSLCGTNTSTGYSLSDTANTIACNDVPGRSMNSPIIFGPLTTIWQSNTQVNSNANCFSNNYSGVSNLPSRDIWYMFNLNNMDSVEISHCTSLATNTFMHLLDGAGIEIASNDSNGAICVGQRASLRLNLPAGTYYIVSELAPSGSGSITTSIRNIVPATTNISIRAFIEGYYSGALTMVPAIFNQGYTGTPVTSTDVDRIKVELRDTSAPFQVFTSDSVMLKTNGMINWSMPAINGNYYVVLKSRNCVETWSNYPVSVSPGNVFYEFNIQANKAFGDNMREVETGIWALFSGDINIDENIDLLDMAILQTDINNFEFGYHVTDLNGDANVDLLDAQPMEININEFIFSIHP